MNTMAIDTTQLAADMAAVIADMPIDLEFAGQTVSGCKSVLKAEELAASAGELAGYRLSVYAVAADWSAAPENGDMLKAAGTEYRVLRTRSDIVGTRYDLGDKYAERS